MLLLLHRMMRVAVTALLSTLSGYIRLTVRTPPVNALHRQELPWDRAESQQVLAVGKLRHDCAPQKARA